MVGPVTTEDEALLLALLNSTPAGPSGVEDILADDASGAGWCRANGGTGSWAELGHVREVRDLLQSILWQRSSACALRSQLAGVCWVPYLADTGSEGVTLALRLQVDDPERRLAVMSVLTYAKTVHERPGRLRPCENSDCRRFLLDRTRGNTARWCSMAICGNRMKARRYYRRTRGAG